MNLEDTLLSDAHTREQIERLESEYGSRVHAIKVAIELLDTIVSQRKNNFNHVLLASIENNHIVELKFSR
ncbi:MAG: hypothetical protein WC655_11055 [Candidatus Hydrogenedentales bacterium]|jgi:predicted dinucleotide-utilizing enzyme